MKIFYGFILISVLLLSGCQILGVDADILKIIDSGDSEGCESLKGEDDDATQTRIDKCYKDYAWAHQEPQLCTQIEKDSQHDSCYENLAKDLQCLSLCEKLKGNTESCFSKVAIAKNDETICTLIPKSRSKDECNAQIGKNKLSIEICDLIDSNFQRTPCMEHIAIETKDLTICDHINGRGVDDCIINVAIGTKDETLCEKSARKRFCYYQMVGVKEDSKLCAKASKDEEEEDECYYKFATVSNNSKICNSIYNKQYETECLEQFAET